ncbi:MAG: LPS export ABC transporter permease LptG [Legionellales bacterium RIFCSPHIGHO2_12_FULL_35_11]|nr:MAG: LPS export ABC transporter permease LptG [Legionellales bacterium RIFCSPHIGHO2_12_FULL_35_11]
MILIEKYIAKTVMAAIFLVICMLTGLQIFILFVNELGDLGKGDYGIIQALSFVIFNMPYQVYLFFPMASLLGCLIGLGVLASNNELVVARSACMSIGQITLVVLKVAVILILIATVLSEVFLPKLVLLGNNNKMQAVTAGQSLRTSHGTWFRYKNNFINIAKVLPDNQIQDVSQFNFDDNNNLVFLRHINSLKYNKNWQAYGVAQTDIGDNHTKTTNIDEMAWDVYINPRMLDMSTNEANEMTFPELNQYLKNQANSHQSIQGYKLAYWQRITQPFTIIVMMLLAIPFIFGPLRSSTMGSKLLLGATTGFGFYIANRFLGSLSQIYQFPAVFAAIAPTIFFALLGLYFMRKVR